MARRAKDPVGEEPAVKKRNKRSPRKDEWDSDALDDVSELESGGTKRKRVEKTPKKTRAAKRKKPQESDEELELHDGQEVVGVLVMAPTTGQVPPGQISQNTLDFLTQLKDPECNDRQWCARLVPVACRSTRLNRFKLHEPVFRQAEKEWKDFIDQFTDLLVEVDPQIPHLPAKDVVHRIYRDVSFSLAR